MSLDILRAVFIRSFSELQFLSCTDLGSSPICPLDASFNAWSRFNGFFLSTLIIYIIYYMVNRLVLMSLMDLMPDVFIHLSNQDHQPAATGTSPYIFILALEPFFFIWS